MKDLNIAMLTDEPHIEIDVRYSYGVGTLNAADFNQLFAVAVILFMGCVACKQLVKGMERVYSYLFLQE